VQVEKVDLFVTLVLSTLALLGIFVRLIVVSDRLLLEHEILVNDYLKRTGQKRDALPKRGIGILSLFFDGKLRIGPPE